MSPDITQIWDSCSQLSVRPLSKLPLRVVSLLRCLTASSSEACLTTCMRISVLSCCRLLDLSRASTWSRTGTPERAKGECACRLMQGKGMGTGIRISSTINPAMLILVSASNPCSCWIISRQTCFLQSKLVDRSYVRTFGIATGETLGAGYVLLGVSSRPRILPQED